MGRARISNLLGKITILLIVCCCSLSVQAKYGGGSGTSGYPYLIYDANHMQAIGADENDWDKCFKLMADIDLSEFTGTSFNIIGNWSNRFTGVFDGNGHNISNFSYTSTGTKYIGLFGYMAGPNAEIKDLGLIDPNIDAGTGLFVGSLVGCLSGDGTITNCYVEGGRVLGDSDTGGLVGWNFYGTISNCDSSSDVRGFYAVGGLVGSQSKGTIANCYSTATVSGDRSVGGLAGRNYDGATSNCYATGSVTGTGGVGGLVGDNGGTITNSYASGGVLANEEVGGLVGKNSWYDPVWISYSGTISNCYSTGSVIGTTAVGGLVGCNEYGEVMDSFWDTETSGEPNMCGSQSACSSGCDPNYGKITSEMKQQTTFENWDFINVWNIGENQTYPYLRTVPAGDINKDRIVNFLDIAILCNQWMEEE